LDQTRYYPTQALHLHQCTSNPDEKDEVARCAAFFLDKKGYPDSIEETTSDSVLQA
jgi:hypothetical protein